MPKQLRLPLRHRQGFAVAQDLQVLEIHGHLADLHNVPLKPHLPTAGKPDGHSLGYDGGRTRARDDVVDAHVEQFVLHVLLVRAQAGDDDQGRTQRTQFVA